MEKRTALLVASLFIGGPMLAQMRTAIPSFEVTSVKPCPAQQETAPGGRRGDGRDS